MIENFSAFYTDKIKAHGATARGVGWKNEDAQEIRFAQLIRVIDPSISFVINDLGCGTGDLVTFLKKQGQEFSYRGYDVIDEMIDLARKKNNLPGKTKFFAVSNAREMEEADYTVASGIFNIRNNQPDDTWLAYILETLSLMNQKSTNGFAFNVLTKYSDTEFMKPELYYADPCFLFDHCKRNFSKNIALLHDYDQYDFTILVRKK